MQQGGDRGKSPNQKGERARKRGARQGTGKVAQAGPKKTAPRTTSKSRDKS